MRVIIIIRTRSTASEENRLQEKHVIDRKNGSRGRSSGSGQWSGRGFGKLPNKSAPQYPTGYHGLPAASAGRERNVKMSYAAAWLARRLRWIYNFCHFSFFFFFYNGSMVQLKTIINILFHLEFCQQTNKQLVTTTITANITIFITRKKNSATTTTGTKKKKKKKARRIRRTGRGGRDGDWLSLKRQSKINTSKR